MSKAATPARPRPRLQKPLAILAIFFQLAAFTTIILVLAAGSQTTSDGGHPGFTTLVSLNMEMFSYRNAARQNNYAYGRDYVFLSSYGWQLSFSQETLGAGYIYRQPCHKIEFPKLFHEMNTTMFGADGVICSSFDSTCSLTISKTFVQPFANSPFVQQTAPSFVLFLLTLVAMAGVAVLQVLSRRVALPERLLPGFFGAQIGAHLIASSHVTSAAIRASRYLNEEQFKSLDLDATLGIGLLLCVWLGFAATLLAGVAYAWREYIKERYTQINKPAFESGDAFNADDDVMLIDRELRTDQSYDTAYHGRT